ncbi:MAG TPA: hypothetical protein VMZ69_09990 [Saprospiraceae bacterium]|nr:hypothetical protein [Saprospiraceae bacterium]
MSFIFVFFFSCKQNEDIQLESLYGKWDITKAERNGKETNYLRNGYFILKPDGNITINITGEDEHGAFALEKNRLLMGNDKIFDIQALNNDSLIVKYVSSSNSEFKFYMLKKKEDVQ